jgi:hypothetical protein
MYVVERWGDKESSETLNCLGLLQQCARETQITENNFKD